MSDYRDGIHCQIDPEQTWESPVGRRVQEVSVVMADDHRFDSGRGWLAPTTCPLTPEEAREFAFELLAVAEHAERIGTLR